MLLRFCMRFTKDRDAAEDLVQQTLLEAWRHEQQLRDPRARRSWLFSIARNMCLMWARGHNRERDRSVALPADQQPAEAGPGDDFDLEIDLEREELARLLDRALALLPAATREVLIGRYVEEMPQAEVAARLGMTEGAVEARVQRGKLALRRILVTDLSDEAIAYGIIPAEHAGWEQTRIWCPGCGQRRLEGRFRPERGELFLRCPGCSRPGTFYIGARLGADLSDLRTYRPALSRVLQSIDFKYRQCMTDGMVVCLGCRQWLPIHRGRPPWAWSSPEVPDTTFVWCPRCGHENTETWHSLTWSLPEARRFWRDHPRMRFLPVREIEAEGSPAVVTAFESLQSASRLEVVMLRDTLTVLRVNGLPQQEQTEGESACD